MGDDSDEKLTAFDLVLIDMKHVMWPLALAIGIHVLTSVSSGAIGFNFLGIIAIVVSVMLLILFCIDCATLDDSFFALAVSHPGKGHSLPGIAYKEYDLSSYSKWMQNKVNDTHRWEKYYKSRLIKHHVCKDMTTEYRLDTIDMFHKRPLNSFESNNVRKLCNCQSGCCKPPEACKFNYISPTNWTKLENHNNSNMDCYTWSNDPTTLCYNCQSCKAGFFQDVKHWDFPAIVAVVVLAKLVLGTLIYALCYCCNPDM
ncbi:tetraspanin-8-like [Silene latifolia]|uniref:tetraspanin-8-like n=1 Tax=Silene latifolia TaxID=37657 RepID=UPI003D77EB19